jgi:prepilin-type N-terminal cleavage/methylation domain-containing protein
MSIQTARMQGFTLLEMTVVLLLVAMISLIIIEALRFGGRAYAQIVDVDEKDREVFLTQFSLRRTLELAYPFKASRANGSAFGVEGTSTHLSWSALASPTRGPGALYRYELTVAADRASPHRLNLLLSRRMDRDGVAAIERPSKAAQALMENIAGLDLSYWDAACGATCEWRNVWQARHELPALIRVRVVFSADDPRQWPDFIVSPRITDDSLFE